MTSFSFKQFLIVVLTLLAKHGVASHSHHDHDHGHSHEANDHRRLNERACATGSDDEGAAQKVFDEWLSVHPCSEESCPFVQEELSRATVGIEVVWHDIRKDDGSEGSTTSMINDSINVLNAAYGSSGFSFSLSNTIVTSSTYYWGASPSSAAEADMKSTLRNGDCSTLNVYSTGQTKYLGWSTFPSNCASNKANDGVVINYQTSPGGTKTNYNLGDTLTHEVGHWLGLYHTFQGGCSEPGDSVSDTPAESGPDFSCQIGRDSCPDGDVRPDDVTNFMNYGDDNCVDHFTTLQIARMHSQWSGFRSTGTSPTPSPPSTVSPPCFSREATVQVEGLGTTKMTQLKIGDRVLAASGGYQPIYGFAHNDNMTKATFLRIHTAVSGETPLEMTGQHLVYINPKDAPVTAASLQVGDSIMLVNGGRATGNAETTLAETTLVTKIEIIERLGLFAPLTASGDIVVDGVASSCYISLQPHGDPQYLELQAWFGGTTQTIVSHHFMAHLLMMVPRVACMGFKPELCQTYTEAGVAHFDQVVTDLGNWFYAQTMLVQCVLLTMAFVFLLPFYILEWVVGPRMTVWSLVTCVMVIAFGRFIGGAMWTKHKNPNGEREKCSSK